MRKFTEEQKKQARSVSIVEILQNNGFEPKRQNARGYWFKSPFRNEKTASFLVDKENRYKDFGATDIHGDSIEFLCKLKNIDFVEAVRILLQNESNQHVSFVCPNTLEKPKETPKTTVEAVKPLSSVRVKDYLLKRKLDIFIVQDYLKEICYTNQGMKYFGIGMENQSGGFEVKNYETGQYYCLNKKDATIIKNPTSKNWSIFEGMFDFLALLTYCAYYKKPFQSNVIVLHSVETIKKILETPQPDAEKIYLFLDNDKAGNEATQELSNHFSQFFKVQDCRYIYQTHKDFNDFLIGKR